MPDVAAVRDQSTGWRRGLRLRLGGWPGTDRQWRHYIAGLWLLAALATPLVLSVHSVVSWDFAMGTSPAGTPRSSRPTSWTAPSSPVRDGAHAAHPAPAGAQARAHLTACHFDHLAKLSSSPAGSCLRIRHGVLHRLVQREHLRAGHLRRPRGRAHTGGPLDDGVLQLPLAAALVQEGPHHAPRCSSSRSSSTSACGSSGS